MWYTVNCEVMYLYSYLYDYIVWKMLSIVKLKLSLYTP
jgi:hypothetical protein